MIDFSLQGKNAFIGGASKGIGKATAIALAQAGASCTIAARSTQALAQLCSELDVSTGQQHRYISLDYSNMVELESNITNFLADHKIDFHILVNNTGGPPAGPISNATTEEFMAAYQQHLLANHLLATKLIPGMIKQAYGRIINIISTSVKIPLEGLGVSNTTRGAVASWAKTLANEVAQYGITVNNVLPGSTDTERLQTIFENKAKKSGQTIEAIISEGIHHVPMRRIGKPEEIAAAVLFLASPAASYITGINLPVDGGRTGSL